ncbi:6-hydroxy-D-nicotine oxidase, partial [Rhizoctonia solani AG-3 Rhs1AP]
MIRASEKKGGNVLGLEPAEDPLMVVTYQFTWKRPEDDKKAYAAINQLVTTSTKLAKSQNRLERYMYLNYAGSDQKVIESYGPAQVDYMRKVRAKYDPDRVFEKLSRGGFKIPS